MFNLNVLITMHARKSLIIQKKFMIQRYSLFHHHKECTNQNDIILILVLLEKFSNMTKLIHFY